MKPEMNPSIPKLRGTFPVAGRDHIQGSIDAPIKLLEYGDYQCPYCGAAHPIVKTVQNRLGNRLCFGFRNFPLTEVHPHAEHAAQAAEAAAAQEKFWEMHDMLFENQDALEDQDIRQYASTLGLDAKRLMAEVLNAAHSARVDEDLRTGTRVGVNGTPTFFINGAPYDGELEVDALLAALPKL
jgi:protein-disulfide isomerase